MTLPAALLAAVERHPCFTGCYRSDSEVQACVDAAQPLEPLVSVACSDCLTFHPGALAGLLPVGMTSYALAGALSAHVRALRGYVWATGGYHTPGGGFWLSAAYYGNGLFLVDSARNRTARTDVETLADAFRLHVLQPEDPRMVDPALYTSELAYVSMATPISGVSSKQITRLAPAQPDAEADLPAGLDRRVPPARLGVGLGAGGLRGIAAGPLRAVGRRSRRPPRRRARWSSGTPVPGAARW
jgi:hypothetical protein